jgi:ABC-type glycerol-3-phosphate transport system permease component
LRSELGTLRYAAGRLVSVSKADAMTGWLKNSAIYSFGGVAMAILAAVPAGYGLALTQFIGRRHVLAITLITMIMPATALVLPLFLEMNSVQPHRHARGP